MLVASSTYHFKLPEIFELTVSCPETLLRLLENIWNPGNIFT